MNSIKKFFTNIKESLVQTISRKLIFINVVIFFITSLIAMLDYPMVMTIFTLLGNTPKLVIEELFLWQLFTNMFIHGNALHLFVNMFVLWSFGDYLIRLIGSNKFLFVYFISGFAASLFVLLFHQGSLIPQIGSSGAVAGVFSAIACLKPNEKIYSLFFKIKILTAYIIFLSLSAIMLFFDTMGGISHAGHLGGMICGYGLTYAMIKLNFIK